MALLQIEDPAARPRPIGIDLGTTNSLVAYVTSNGVPQTIEDCDGHVLVPSVVHYSPGGEVLVGDAAKRHLTTSPTNTIASVKRFMGRGVGEADAGRAETYKLGTTSSAGGDVLRFEVGPDHEVTPIEVSAEILRELKQRAQDELGPISGAVITVPAHFDDAQRQATKDAARLADLEVIRLLNEPTAAALAYGLDKKVDGLFAVYDLGGGTFDVTILSLDQGVFQVRSTGGDTRLGGDDFDRALAELVFAEIARQSPSTKPKESPHAVASILATAREAKHALTDTARVEIDLSPFGAETPLAITRETFEAGIRSFIERTGSVCRRALRDAGIKPDALDGVILVGGATRVPSVRTYVAQVFGRTPLTDIDPDQVVALGAAVQADAIASETPEHQVLLLDVLPLSLGVETMGGVVERILPRNTPIPAAAKQTFTTYADNQTGFDLHVVQGERDLATECRSLARFTLKGVPANVAGLPRLEVTFNVDADGILHVSARETTTGVEQAIDVKPTYGLRDEEIEQMLLDAYEHGEADIAARKLIERRVDAERMASATESALASDASLITKDEVAAIRAALDEIRHSTSGNDATKIDAAIDSLDRATRNFASRRMDASIGRALAGRNLKSVEEETKHARGLEHAHDTEIVNAPRSIPT